MYKDFPIEINQHDIDSNHLNCNIIVSLEYFHLGHVGPEFQPSLEMLLLDRFSMVVGSPIDY